MNKFYFDIINFLMKYFIGIFSIIIFFNFLQESSSENINDAKSLLEGRYELVYWQQDNLKFHFQKVSGTFVIFNNKISFT